MDMISHSVVKKTEANSVQNDWKYIIILCKKTGKNIEELGKPSCSWFISILLRFNRQKYANIDMLYLLYRMFVHVNGWKCANMRRCYQQKVRKWFFKYSHSTHLYAIDHHQLSSNDMRDSVSTVLNAFSYTDTHFCYDKIYFANGFLMRRHLNGKIHYWNRHCASVWYVWML